MTHSDGPALCRACTDHSRSAGFAHRPGSV